MASRTGYNPGRGETPMVEVTDTIDVAQAGSAGKGGDNRESTPRRVASQPPGSVLAGNLAIIGGGMMGGAIAGRVVETGLTTPDRVVVSEPSQPLRDALQARLGIRTIFDNRAAVEGAST